MKKPWDLFSISHSSYLNSLRDNGDCARMLSHPRWLLVCLSDFGEIMTKARSQYLHMIIPI